jgi:hypothetical protein
MRIDRNLTCPPANALANTMRMRIVIHVTRAGADGAAATILTGTIRLPLAKISQVTSICIGGLASKGPCFARRKRASRSRAMVPARRPDGLEGVTGDPGGFWEASGTTGNFDPQARFPSRRHCWR